jgi:hypothetical protein
MREDKILSWDEFLKIPPPDYLWGTLVRRHAVNIFQGWPQSAKSFIALHLGMAIASGATEFLDLSIRDQLEVTYFSLEDVEADAERARQSNYRDVDEFHVYAGTLSLTKEAKEPTHFFNLLDEVSPEGLIIIDSFSAGSGVDSENDSADVQDVYNLFFEAARQGHTVIVIVHIGKKADPFSVLASRGSSAAAGAASSIIGFRDWGDNRFELQQAKNRTDPDKGGLFFALDSDGPYPIESPDVEVKASFQKR